MCIVFQADDEVRVLIKGLTVDQVTDFVGTAKIFWSGRSQAVRLPAACRFEVDEVEIVKRGDTVTLRPKGKDWAEFFDAEERASLPPRDQPPLERRRDIR